MKHPWKIWTKFGNLSKGVNRHNFIKIYFTVGFIVLIGGFIGFSQILIKNIREDSRKAPSLFARYIFNTKSYLDEAQVNYQAVITNIDAVNKNYEQANDNSKLLAEIFTLWVNSLSDVRGEEKLREYFASEFAQSLTFPIILTDENNRPLTWKNCSIMETEYSYLRKTSQDSLKALLGKMEKIDVKIQGKVLNSIHYLPMTNSLKKPPVPPLDFEDFIKNMSQPIIITDQNNTPVIWNNIIGVPNYVEYFKLSFNFKDQLTRAINEMSAIPVSSELHSNIKNIYVSPIVSIDNMNIFMILQFVLVIVFVLFGMLGIKLIRRTENDLIWVGLAKETAHQLGTPITSLLGWIEYLKIKEEFEDQENQEMLKQMESDVTHLGGIASRFGKIGSHMKLEPLELNPIIENTVDYIKIRLPHLGSKIELRLDSTIGRTVIKTDCR
ncbi:MAG: hypothetical protein B6226_02755 [Candidatus Cloacimonetes bacterium 4572_65]|nr:MAG: hypothetical protein B6226_02755 [Candidatus Cloacimonetes bacterium 4572_65]